MDTTVTRSPRPDSSPSRALAALAGLAAMLVLGACAGTWTAGSGPTISEQRPIGTYTRIEAGSGIDVDVRFGSTPSIEVEAAENLLPLVVTRIDGGTLEILATSELLTAQAPRVHVVVPDLETISLDGGTHADVDALAGGSLAVQLSGGSTLTATGSVATLAVDAGGGAVASLRDLAAATVLVDLGGGARAELQASDSVVGDVGGGASLTVSGDARVDVDSSGGGSVNRG